VPVDDLPVHARIEDVLHEDVTLSAGPRHALAADPGIRILAGQDVVDAVAVVAGRSHDQAVHQQRLAVDGVDEVGHRLVVIDGTGIEDDLALVTLGAGLVEIELVGSGPSIRRSQDCVVAVAVLAGRGLFVSLRVPAAVDAPLVLLHDIVVAFGAGAVQGQRLALVVGSVVEIPGATVTVGADLRVVDRALQDLLVHGERERFAPIGLRLQLVVFVAAQAVSAVERLVVALAVDRLIDHRGSGGSAGEQHQQGEGERDPWPNRHEPSPPATREPGRCGAGSRRLAALGRGGAVEANARPRATRARPGLHATNTAPRTPR
jgi:hypothetical protein